MPDEPEPLPDEPEPPVTVTGPVDPPASPPPDAWTGFPPRVEPAVSPVNVATPSCAGSVAVWPPPPGSVIVTLPSNDVSTFPYGSSAATTTVNVCPGVSVVGGGVVKTSWLAAADVTATAVLPAIAPLDESVAVIVRSPAVSIITPVKVCEPASAAVNV